MSILTMVKKCVHCGRRYTYNPSVGRFGWICPHCGKPQMSTKKGQYPNIFPND